MKRPIKEENKPSGKGAKQLFSVFPLHILFESVQNMNKINYNILIVL